MTKKYLSSSLSMHLINRLTPLLKIGPNNQATELKKNCILGGIGSFNTPSYIKNKQSIDDNYLTAI